MNQHLMKAVLECAAFYALSDEAIINPDAAVAQLDQLASFLRNLTPEEADEFGRYVQDTLITERHSASKARLEFLGGFVDNLGIAK
jgi:hypothetical protein